ncbi:MAG TPA: hypothetical protein VJL88_08145 [Nitrospira sp.]|nr:hypothetical protein [Nitrospira sp.]
MAKIEPTKPRVQISDDRGNLRIVIPVRRNWFHIIFIGFWLCIWISAAPQMISGNVKQPAGLLFKPAMLGLWAVATAAAIYIWIWNFLGKEVVLVNMQSLTTRRELGSVGRTREFTLSEIRDLRVSSTFNPADFSSSLQFWGIGGGSIAFDYGAKTYRFGSGLDDAESKLIINAIKSRFKIDDTERR